MYNKCNFKKILQFIESNLEGIMENILYKRNEKFTAMQSGKL